MMALALLFTATAHAAAPGITGTSFSLTAQSAFLNSRTGAAVYAWGYGCATTFTAGLRSGDAKPEMPPRCKFLVRR